MAKRDVDVVIGASTDDASFQRARRRTEGFLSRLRRREDVAGGQNATDGALQQTSRAAETISKVVQIAALLREGVGVLNAGLEIGRGIMAGMAGDAEAMDKALLSAKESISQTTLGAAGTAVGEMIFGDRRDAERIEQEMIENERRNNQRRDQANRFRQAALREIEETARAERLHGLEGIELSKEQARIRTESLLEELQIMQQQTRNRQVQLQLDEAMAAVRRRQELEFENLEQRDQRVQGATQGGAVEARTAGITSGLLLSGNAAAARADGATQFVQNQSKQIDMERRAAEQRDEQLQALQQLIQATNLQSASRPFLN